MLSHQIKKIHLNLNESFSSLCRIAIAIYDDQTDTLKTFTHSTHGTNPITYYASKLANSESLSSLASHRGVRIIDDISLIPSDKLHSRQIKAAGYLSSLTCPLFNNDHLIGFLFMNAKQACYFSRSRVEQLDIYIQLITTLVIAETMPIKILQGAVATAQGFSRIKDEETGAHLARMSHYARLIALEIGQKYGLSNQAVEYIFQFAPLHDVGKVGIPDAIILKQGLLNDTERATVQEHVLIGGKIIDMMIEQFNLGGLDHVQILKNIVLYHHECYDGSGYPSGLKGESIPIESRITSTADVFDALTSKRPYKEAWSNRKALDYMQEHKSTIFDPDCVDALVSNQQDLLRIQERFKEESIA